MSYQEFLESKTVSAPVSGFDIDLSELNPVLKEHQKISVQWACQGGRRALFESFGLGKCHGAGTKILMYDCSVKNVEDVMVGDLLMGDDGTPRKVLSLAHGRDMLYKVTLTNKDTFTCNSAHILSCEISNKYGSHRSGDVVNISLTEYLELPEYAKKNCFKAYKRPLDFPESDVPIDPYVYGVWLGDGTVNKLVFTINSNDFQIVDYLDRWAERCNLVRNDRHERGCTTYNYSKGLYNNKHYPEKEFIKSSSVGGKHIVKEYLYNSRDVRLKVLAGLLDTDGYLIDNCYEIATKWEQMKDDILFLCRSLGLSVTWGIKTVNEKDYWRIWISGDTGIIPCLTRKKAHERKQIKNPLRYGFEVEPIGEGDYYGFVIDGNHLYMLADFTVTHNTSQTLEYCRMVLKHEDEAEPGVKHQALIVCPLGVKQEFTNDAENLLGWDRIPEYVRDMAEIRATDNPVLLTNYERVRDGDIDPTYFTACCLDEASVLRSFGSKTYQTFLDKFTGVRYKLVATATPDHKLWTRKSELAHKKEGMRRAVPEWVEAKDTVGHYVNLKLPPIEESLLNEKEWWLVGRYLADGHKGTRGDWFISVGADKCEEFERMAFGFYGSHAERDARQYRLLSGSMSDELKAMLDKCGRGAMNKQVPIEGICLNPTLAEALLDGYLSGDGNTTGNCTSASSISRALLLGMAMVAQRARGVIASVYAGRGERTSTIEGREVHCNPEWVMSWRVSGHHCESEILEDGAWKKVKESIATGEREVWSIQVADDASYTAEGCIVKNCPLQLDIVERIINRYSNEGDVVYDPFGGLMTVPMTAVKMGRYGIGCELNNGYFRDGVGYLKLAEEERDEPEKQITMGIPTLADLTEGDDAEH